MKSLERVLLCDCGFEARAEHDDELVAKVQRHAWEAHAMALASDEARSLASRAKKAKRKRSGGTMTSIAAILGLLLAAVAAGAFADASAGENTHSASPSEELHVTKECGEYHGKAGQFCTITSSNLNAIKPGSRVFYLQDAGPDSLDSDIVLVVGPGNYALGHVTLDFATGTGEVRFSGGTRQFTSFHAKVAVSTEDGTNWAWDGEYRFGRDDD